MTINHVYIIILNNQLIISTYPLYFKDRPVLIIIKPLSIKTRCFMLNLFFNSHFPITEYSLCKMNGISGLVSPPFRHPHNFVFIPSHSCLLVNICVICNIWICSSAETYLHQCETEYRNFPVPREYHGC